MTTNDKLQRLTAVLRQIRDEHPSQWLTDTLIDDVLNVQQPTIVRRGWRVFACKHSGEMDCGTQFVWAEPTRDHLSPPIEACPICYADCEPIRSWPDTLLAVDQWGNLVNCGLGVELHEKSRVEYDSVQQDREQGETFDER